MDYDGQTFTGVTTSQLNTQFRFKSVDLSNGDVTDLTPNWTHYGKSQDGKNGALISVLDQDLMYGVFSPQLYMERSLHLRVKSHSHLV